MERGRCIKAETGKCLSSSFTSAASIILPSENSKVKVVEQQRLKPEFALVNIWRQGYLQGTHTFPPRPLDAALLAVFLSATGGRVFSSAGFFIAARAAQLGLLGSCLQAPAS